MNHNANGDVRPGSLGTKREGTPDRMMAPHTENLTPGCAMRYEKLKSTQSLTGRGGKATRVARQNIALGEVIMGRPSPGRIPVVHALIRLDVVVLHDFGPALHVFGEKRFERSNGAASRHQTELGQTLAEFIALDGISCARAFSLFTAASGVPLRTKIPCQESPTKRE